MAYKLIEAAQTRWRAVNAPRLVALVRAGALFHIGRPLERAVDITPTARAESSETDVVGRGIDRGGGSGREKAKPESDFTASHPA